MDAVDLHMHSSFSDGAHSPQELVAMGEKKGLRMMALTDHDELTGLAPMRLACEQAGIRFVPGVEITTKWGGKSVHVVGLGFDENHPGLRQFLSGLRQRRLKRAQAIAQKFEDLGFENVWAQVCEQVGNPDLVSRNHFAGWLVEIGACKNRNKAFEKYLGEGCPAYVVAPGFLPVEAVKVILAADGVPVLAHPGRYGFNPWQLEALLCEFKEAGGIAIEVNTGSHKSEDVPRFAEIALAMGFEASSGSDFHREPARCKVGEQGDLDGRLCPVWRRFES